MLHHLLARSGSLRASLRPNRATVVYFATSRMFSVKDGMDPVEANKKDKQKGVIDVAQEIEEVLAQEKQSPLTLKGGMGPVDEELEKQERNDLTAKIEAEELSKEKASENQSPKSPNLASFHEVLDPITTQHERAVDLSLNEQDTKDDQDTKDTKSFSPEKGDRTKEEELPGQGQKKPMTAKAPQSEDRYRYFSENFESDTPPSDRTSHTASGMMDAMKTTAQSLKQSSHDLTEAAKGSIKDMTEKAKQAVSTAFMSREKDKKEHEKRDESAEEQNSQMSEESKKSKQEKFANSRQNSSIL